MLSFNEEMTPEILGALSVRPHLLARHLPKSDGPARFPRWPSRSLGRRSGSGEVLKSALQAKGAYLAQRMETLNALPARLDAKAWSPPEESRC